MESRDGEEKDEGKVEKWKGWRSEDRYEKDREGKLRSKRKVGE